GLDPVAAVRARVVACEEGSDHELAGLDRGDVTTDGLDDAAIFVAERGGLGHGGKAAVLPEIRAADTGGGDADDRIGGSDDLRLGNVLRPHITGAIDDTSSHKAFSFNHFERHKASSSIPRRPSPHARESSQIWRAAGVTRPQRHLIPHPIDGRWSGSTGRPASTASTAARTSAAVTGSPFLGRESSS